MLADNLIVKLGIRMGMAIAMVDPPEDFRAQFSARISDLATMTDPGSSTRPDMLLWWPQTLEGFEQRLAEYAHIIPPDGAIWIVIPKKKYAPARRINFSWSELQLAGLRTDMVDNKTASFSDSDYGTRFVIHVEKREHYK